MKFVCHFFLPKNSDKMELNVNNWPFKRIFFFASTHITEQQSLLLQMFLLEMLKR